MSTPNFVVAPPQAPASLAALIAQHHALVRAEAIDNPAATLCRAEFAGFSQAFFQEEGVESKTFFGGQGEWGSHIISAKGTSGSGGMGRGSRGRRGRGSRKPFGPQRRAATRQSLAALEVGKQSNDNGPFEGLFSCPEFGDEKALRLDGADVSGRDTSSGAEVDRKSLSKWANKRQFIEEYDHTPRNRGKFVPAHWKDKRDTVVARFIVFLAPELKRLATGRRAKVLESLPRKVSWEAVQQWKDGSVPLPVDVGEKWCADLRKIAAQATELEQEVAAETAKSAARIRRRAVQFHKGWREGRKVE